MIDEGLSKHEELLLKSWDSSLSGEERTMLAAQMQENASLRWQSDQYLKVRTLLHRTEPDTFGPFFAERILNVIKNRTEKIEYLIFFFFKKYQVLVAGIFVALLITNLLLSDSLTVRAILGLEQQTTEDVYSINLYNDLTQ
jgi:hypothetical protein